MTLWEILTHGEQPYKDSKLQEVIRRVRSGERLAKPEGCPDELYAMMMMCWNIERSRRPSFASILSTLDAIISSDGMPKLRDVGALLNGQLSTQIRTLTVKKKFAPGHFHSSVSRR